MDDWKRFRQEAILKRRRAGLEGPARHAGVYVNYPAPRRIEEVRSYGFYFRWAFDNITELVLRADTEEEYNTAAALYAIALDAGATLGVLASYQLGEASPLKEEG